MSPFPSPDDLEAILFECLERPRAEQEAALAAACARHPELAEALRRCWLHVRRMQRPAHGDGAPGTDGDASGAAGTDAG